MTPSKTESPIVTVARDSIAANETLDASDSYRRRINTYPVMGISHRMDGSILRPARSHIEVSYVRDDGEKFISSLTETRYRDDLWVNENGTYGLEILFMSQCDLEEKEIEDVILQKTKNKLYEIFLRVCPNKPISRPGRTLQRRIGVVEGTGVLVTPGKRSLSPQPEHHQGNPTKTACRTPGSSSSRCRANSTCGTARVNKPKTRKRLYTLSGQKLLTQMWRSNVA